MQGFCNIFLYKCADFFITPHFDFAKYIITFVKLSTKTCNMDVLLTKEYITGLIAKKGMSKSEFAEKMGYKRQNLDAMLDSQKKDINTVVRMSEVLDIPLLELIGLKQHTDTIYGVLYVDNKPVIVNSREEIEELLKKISE